MAMRRFTKIALEEFLSENLKCIKTKNTLPRYDIWERPNGVKFMVPAKSEEADGLFPDYLLNDIVETVGPSPSEYIENKIEAKEQKTGTEE